MRLRFTKPYITLYSKLPEEIKKRVDKQLHLLLHNPMHPSLHLHKMKGRNLWEIYVTKNYRATFEIKGDEYVMQHVGTHDILKK